MHYLSAANSLTPRTSAARRGRGPRPIGPSNNRAENVGLKSLRRLTVGAAHQRLRRQMEHDLRSRGFHRVAQSVTVPNVGGDRLHAVGQIAQGEI